MTVIGYVLVVVEVHKLMVKDLSIGYECDCYEKETDEKFPAHRSRIILWPFVFDHNSFSDEGIDPQAETHLITPIGAEARREFLII